MLALVELNKISFGRNAWLAFGGSLRFNQSAWVFTANTQWQIAARYCDCCLETRSQKQ